MQRKGDERFMQMALEQAEIALNNGWIPVGAVFVKDNEPLAHARKTGLRHTLFDHAEFNGCMQLLWHRNAPRNLEGFTVYSTLEPCLNCMSLLFHVRVSRIVYGFPDPHGGAKSFNEHPEILPARFKTKRPAVEKHLLPDESRELLHRFFLGPGKDWGDSDNELRLAVLSDENPLV